jgi:hypothetical protein
LPFRFFNPSVAVVADRVYISLRGASVERSDVTGLFYLLRPHTEIRSEIVVGEYDEDLACRRHFQANWRDVKTGAPFCPGGFEDTRLIVAPGGAVIGIACTPGPERGVRADGEMIFHPKFRIRISRLEFGPEFQITNVTTYASPFDRLREKNWSPFYHEGRLCVVYQWNPLIVMELVPDGTTRFLKWGHVAPLFKDLRGGSPGIATKDGYLFVVHRRFFAADKLRFAHLFVELGHDLLPRRISREFCFLSTDVIEYGAGLAEAGGSYLVTFGLDDALSFVAEVPVESVERLLLPLEEPVLEDKAILGASREEQHTAASVDFPKDPDLGPTRLLKLRVKDWLDRAFRRNARG